MAAQNLSIRPLSAALQKKAEKELNENPEKIKDYLQLLKDWIESQPDLKSMKTTNQWLISFLRGCKYDIEKTKKKITTYNKLKKSVPEIFGNRDPFDSNIQEILKIGVLLPLRNNTDDDCPRLCLARTGAFSTETKRPFVELLKVSFMIMEILLIEDDNFCIAGEDSLNDLKGETYRIMKEFTPSVARNVVNYIENSITVRLKSLQLLNAPYGVSIVITILRMFLSKKLKNRILLLGKDSQLNHLDKSLLPVEYGGTNGTLQEHIDYWKKKVESYRGWFMDE